MDGNGIFILVLGAGLIGLELFITSHGVLAISGLVALIIGTFLTYPSELEFVHLAASMGWGLSVLAILYAALFIGVAWHLRKKPAISGIESLTGEEGRVKSVSPEGCLIHIRGDEWLATLESGRFQVGQRVRVVAVQGLKVVVAPIDN